MPKLIFFRLSQAPPQEPPRHEERARAPPLGAGAGPIPHEGAEEQAAAEQTGLMEEKIKMRTNVKNYDYVKNIHHLTFLGSF